MKGKTLILILGLTVLFQCLQAQKRLTFEGVFIDKAEALLPPLPEILEWIDDDHYLEIREDKVVKVRALSGRYSLLFCSDQYDSLKREGLDLSDMVDYTRDFEKTAYVKSGDLFLFFKIPNKLINIPSPSGDKQNPRFSPDGRFLAFTVSGNLFVYDIKREQIQVATRDGNREILNGYASWVYYEEILGRGTEYRAFWWSPDSSRIVFMRFDQRGVSRFTITGSDGDYGFQELQYYPKSGYPNPEVKMGVLDVSGNIIDWIDFSCENDCYMSFMEWGKESREFYFQKMNRDQNSLRVFGYNVDTKKCEAIYKENQTHWIEFFSEGDWALLSGGGVIVRSSKSGWYHLYYLNRNGKEICLTRGNWSVSRIIRVDENAGLVYFEAWPESSLDVHLYRVNFYGRHLEQLTVIPGVHRILSSEEGGYILDTYSSLKKPPRLELLNGNGKPLRTIGDRSTPELEACELGEVEQFRIPTADGLSLPIVWYLPPGFDSDRRYPVVIRIYGAPGSRNVRNRFDSRLSQFYLSQQGIISMRIDHRGSGHFGKAFTDLMHRNLGQWEIHDLIEIVKHLRKLPFIDGEKIGIWGGSYGGYVASLALCRASDYFSHGIADSSVIDWRWYDSAYTERYMDTPKQNPDGYRKSSVLTHIAGYRGGLRLTHGSMDDNVHMQHTFQFLKTAAESGKSVELMIYPGERHGYKREAGTTEKRAAMAFWLKHLLGKETVE